MCSVLFIDIPSNIVSNARCVIGLMIMSDFPFLYMCVNSYFFQLFGMCENHDKLDMLGFVFIFCECNFKTVAQISQNIPRILVG